MIPEDTAERAIADLIATLDTYLTDYDPDAIYSRDDDQVDTTATALTAALLAGGWTPPIPESDDPDSEEDSRVIRVDFTQPRRPCRQRRRPRGGR
ncbi:MAG: hypothetical protein ACRDXB_07205 [Actinomycetes bacterium]